MSAPESVVRALLGIVPPNLHGQLCPVWRKRNRNTGGPGPLDECNCWQVQHARSRADAAFAASLEWAAASMLHTCTCHPSDDDSAHCVGPVARQLRRWARGES